MSKREYRDYDAERCVLSVQYRDNGTPVISGYGAVFYRKDDPGTEFNFLGMIKERIMPTAFDRAIAEKQDVAGLFNHDENQILGRTSSGTMTLTKTKRGLKYEIEPPPTKEDVVESIARGDVHGSSFAFLIRSETWRSEKDDSGKTVAEIREIHDVDLFDVGPVVFPAYGATTAGVRSLDEAAELPETAEIVKSYRRWKARMADVYQRGQEVED